MKRIEKSARDEKTEKTGRTSCETKEPKPVTPGGKLSYKETRELEALPERIAALEAEIAEIETALADPAIYARENARALELSARLPTAREELDAAETRWLELSERV